MKKIYALLALFALTIIVSCSKDEDAPNENYNISIFVDQPAKRAGQTFTFTVLKSDATDITSQAQITVGSTVITGNTFVGTTLGTFTVSATFSGKTTNPITITVEDPNSIYFNKRVLIEDFTGTWCGYCPRVSYAIEQVKSQTTDVSVVAIHRSGSDPFILSAATPLENQIGLTGYPTAMLNRTTTWAYPEPSNVNQALNLTSGANPRVGLAFENSMVGNVATVTVKTKYGADFTGLKLVVYALEDNLIYNQANYTSYFGGASTITGFRHDHVARAVLTSTILGDAITGSTNISEESTRTFTYTIPANVNAANLHFTAVVVGSNNAALNSRSASTTANQTFEIE